MSGKKIVLAILICIMLFVSVAAGVVWHLTHYALVDMKFYARDAESMDLRDQEISVSHYEKLKKALPDCEIHWNVPFQGETYPEDTTEITVTTLSDKDLQAAAYMQSLKTVHAVGCTDYDRLLQLQEENPRLLVEYTVTFSEGTVYAQDAEEVTVRSVTEEDIQLLRYLPRLQRVTVVTGGSMDNMAALCGTAHNLGLEFGVRIGGQIIPATTESLELTGLTEEEAPLLQLLGLLQELHVQEPEMTAEQLLSLRQQYPHVQISWEVELFGQTFPDSVTEVDLSQVEITDIAQVEAAMASLPCVEKVILGLCGFDDSSWGNSKAKNIAVCPIENEAMAAWRDRVRDQYKVVWTVRVGPHIALRTDADNFMPGHFNIGRLFTDEAYNLRY